MGLVLTQLSRAMKGYKLYKAVQKGLCVQCYSGVYRTKGMPLLQSYTGLYMADERALQNRPGSARGKNVGKDLLNIPTKSPMFVIHTQTFGHRRWRHV